MRIKREELLKQAAAAGVQIDVKTAARGVGDNWTVAHDEIEDHSNVIEVDAPIAKAWADYQATLNTRFAGNPEITPTVLDVSPTDMEVGTEF